MTKRALRRPNVRPPIPLSAVLLAGGKSRRMGQDKALMHFEGEAMWWRQLRLLRLLKPRQLIVSGSRRAEFPATLRCVEDSGPGGGPLAGLAAALRVARCRRVLVLAVDMPGMTPEFLAHLHALAPDGGGVVPFLAVAGQATRFYEPLAAIYPRACLPIAERQLLGRDWSMQKFVRSAVAAGMLAEFEIPRRARKYFQNFNTPADARNQLT